MGNATHRVFAAAITASAVIHLFLVLSPASWYTMPLVKTWPSSAPSPQYTLMLRLSVASVKLPEQPKKKPDAAPQTPRKIAPETPVNTPPTPSQMVYEAAQLTDNPRPVGIVALDDFPDGTPTRGSVQLTLLIDSQGRVVDITASNSTMSHEAETHTIEAFRNTQFQPGTVNGEPVSSRITIEVNLQALN